MILYFSGTGNSEYVAKRIGEKISDQVVSLFEKIRAGDFSEMHSSRAWVVVAPTYAWRIPRMVQTWLEHTDFVGNRDIYFVMTCGGSIGNAGKYLQRLCDAKQWHYMGCAAITMPENYIALFTTPAEKEALEIIGRAENTIEKTALLIGQGKAFSQPAVTLQDKMNSAMINRVFYPMFVHAKKFYATDACISCGKCADVCPLCNVRLENGRPVWGANCTHCMACISRCPSEAIEYGEHSKGMPRYLCPKYIDERAHK